VLSDTTICYKELAIRPVPAAELYSPFFQNNIRGHIHDGAMREVITCGTVPVWADPHEVHISEHIAGQPLQPWQLSLTVAEFILSKSEDSEDELFDRAIFTQIVMGPKKGEISFVVAPGRMQVAWEYRHWVDRLLTGSFPTITGPIRWTSYTPPTNHTCGMEEASPTPIPAHGFVDNQGDDQDHDSVETEDQFSAETVLKAPPEEKSSEGDSQNDQGGPDGEVPTQITPSSEQTEHLTPTRELVQLLLQEQEIRDLKLQMQKRDDDMSNEIKELKSRHDATTQSLTTLGRDITVLAQGPNSPDNLSGLTGSSQTSLTQAIFSTITDAITAAYSPGGIVSKQCEEDANMTNEQFALMVRENVLDGIFPEIQETIISAIRDQTEAMTRLLRHPERIQAGEIANVVKKHLNPSLNAMSEGLLRLATSVEVALKAPPHSSLGSLAHEVSPTYELIKDTRNAIRLLGSRIANGLEYLYKVGFSIMESLSREQRIEAEHERAVRKYLKNIKAVTDLVMITIETKEPESHSFTKALVRYMSLAKSAQAEFEAHFASQTEPLQQPVQGPHERRMGHLTVPLIHSVSQAMISMEIQMMNGGLMRLILRRWIDTPAN
jgi:hypothetical protein